jgi:hypothetical protein
MWGEFARGAPALAAAGERLLADAPAVPGVAFLATVGPNGQPRVHPFIPAIVDGRLVAFIVDGPKQRDLERGSRHAIHSRLGAADESFLLMGAAVRIDDDAARAAAASAMPYEDIDDRHVLYEFTVDRVLWTTWKTPTTPTYRRWSSR